jgi:hypothetical protein
MIPHYLPPSASPLTGLLISYYRLTLDVCERRRNYETQYNIVLRQVESALRLANKECENCTYFLLADCLSFLVYSLVLLVSRSNFDT